MGYRYPGNEKKAAIEVFPVAGKKSLAAAGAAGLAASTIPTLRVVGDNKRGLGHAIAEAMAEAGINMGFLVAQVMGGRYTAIIGFDSEEDADKATALIKKASSVRRK
jgi:predicted amino acid-binding ACT domain protein